MNKVFKNFIKTIKDIKLSESEKALLRSKISEFMSFNPIRGEIEVPGNKNYLSIFEVRHFLKATSLLLIFAVIAGGTGVSYAAQNALPGDKLYGIKVNVNEEIKEHLAFTPEAKVAVQAEKVERRLEEAQVLVKENKLSANTRKIVEDKIDEHIKDLSHEIEVLKDEGRVETVLETTAKLTPVLEAHKEILEEGKDEDTNDDQDTTTLIAKVDESIKTVEAEENDIIADALDRGDVHEEETATLATTISVEEDIDTEATKEAAQALDNISDEITGIVEGRIKAAKEKIRDIKLEETRKKAIEEEILEKEALLKTSTEVKTDTSLETSIESSLDKAVSAKPQTSTEVSLETESANTEDEPAEVEEVSEKTETFDIDAKIKEGEDLIQKAESELNRKHFKEALSLAQEVNRIAAEIETHKRLEALEIAKENLIKNLESYVFNCD